MRAHFFRYVTDVQGHALDEATIDVYKAGGSEPANIYTAETGGTPIHSILSSSDGSFEFWVQSSDYEPLTQEFKIVITKSGYPGKTFDFINIFPLMEHVHPNYDNHLTSIIDYETMVHGLKLGEEGGIDADKLRGKTPDELGGGGGCIIHQQVNVQSGSVKHGNYIPRPIMWEGNPYLDNQCVWIVSSKHISTTIAIPSGGGTRHTVSRCFASLNGLVSDNQRGRKVFCKVEGDVYVENDGGWANYIIMGFDWVSCAGSPVTWPTSRPTLE